jgi:hypothetical protein
VAFREAANSVPLAIGSQSWRPVAVPQQFLNDSSLGNAFFHKQPMAIHTVEFAFRTAATRAVESANRPARDSGGLARFSSFFDVAEHRGLR